MHPIIRRLKAGEADLYRCLRLESLRESPEAFSSTYEAALARSHDSWVAQADGSASGGDRATFVVLGGEPLGLAALYRDNALPRTGELIQVWISPRHRGGTLAAALMDTLLQWAAANDFDNIRAEITPGNPRALRFYEKQGFHRITASDAPAGTGHILTKSIV